LFEQNGKNVRYDPNNEGRGRTRGSPLQKKRKIKSKIKSKKKSKRKSKIKIMT